MKKTTRLYVRLALLLILVILIIFAYFSYEYHLLSTYGLSCEGKKIEFDIKTSSIMEKQDAEMTKLGYIVEEKTVDSHRDDGMVELLPYNEIPMNMLVVKSTYVLPKHKIGTKLSLLQKSILFVQSKLGIFPKIFYPEVLLKNGEISREVTTDITNLFVIVNPNSKSPQDNRAYASTSQRIDYIKYSKATQIHNSSHIFETSSFDTLKYNSPHYEGNLNWVKQMAYSNYVSPYDVSDAYELPPININK